jgi:Ca2+-binding EF-hand superfamily protein
MKPEDLKHKSWGITNNNHNSAGLTHQNKAQFDRLSDSRSGPISKRPMSAVTRTTS